MPIPLSIHAAGATTRTNLTISLAKYRDAIPYMQINKAPSFFQAKYYRVISSTSIDCSAYSDASSIASSAAIYSFFSFFLSFLSPFFFIFRISLSFLHLSASFNNFLA